jgi:hypothetical protein
MSSDNERSPRFGPVTLSSTDADDGARLYLSNEAIEESGLEADSAVILQPYENGIHVFDATGAVFDE